MLNPPIRPIGLRRRLRLQNYKNILKKTNRIRLYIYSLTKKLFLSLFEDLTEIAYIHNTVKSQIEKLRIVQVHFSSLYSDSLFYSK